MKQLQGVIYYRVSTAEQAEHGFSLETQKEVCLKAAEKHDIKVIKLFSDDGLSAKTADRPGLQALLKYCANKNNQVSFVIVYKVDRLSRNVNDYANIVAVLHKQKIKLLSATEAIDETPFGKAVGNIMATFAQLDNDMRSERTREGMQQCLASGRFPHKAPLGYLNAVTPQGNKHIILDSQRAETIKFILEQFSKGIYTQEELRQKVNKQGFKTNRGSPLSFQMISKILTNKFYAGIMTIKGVEYQGTHEPLISELIYYKNQKLLGQKTIQPSLELTSEFALRNYVICGFCQRPVTAGFSIGRWGGRYPYYRCYNKNCLFRKSIPKDMLENGFIKLLQDITPTEENLASLKEVIIKHWDSQYKNINQKREQAEKKLAELQAEKQQILNLAKKQLIPDEDFKEEFAAIKHKIADQQLLLSETQIEDFNVQEACDFVFAFIRRVPEYWAKTPDYTKKVRLQGLIFKKNPVYRFPTFTTPTLTNLYRAKELVSNQNSMVVAPRGIEPRLPG